MSTTTIHLNELHHALNTLLEPHRFKDYCPNGLQVEGRAEIRHVVVGVSANDALIRRAAQLGGDTIVAHHGLFWGGGPMTLRSYHYRRVKLLMEHDMSLFGYHLPLDAHAEVGNNVEVLRAIGATPTASFGEESPQIAWRGELAQPTPRDTVLARLTEAVGPAVAEFLEGPETIRSIGIVTGGGDRWFDPAIDHGVDLFISGEPSEQSQGIAAERGANFTARGHHRTETFGPRALGQWIERELGLRVSFVDIDNPV